MSGLSPAANRIRRAAGNFRAALINVEALIRAAGGVRDPKGAKVLGRNLLIPIRSKRDKEPQNPQYPLMLARR